MNHLDKNDRLKNAPFDYQVTKSDVVIIFYEGKQIMTLGKKDSLKFLNRIDHMAAFDQQLELAKVTGNFKRGNEKDSKTGLKGDK